MLTLFAFLFGYPALMELAFIVAMGRPWRHEDPVAAWIWSGTALLALAFDSVWFLVTVGAGGHWVAWALGVILVASGLFFTWRLWLVLRDKRKRH